MLICLKKVIIYNLIIYHKQWKAPFVIYADFGSNLREVQKPNRDNDDASYTNKYQKHIAYCILLSENILR